MDYEKMWKVLKENIESNKEYYGGTSTHPKYKVCPTCSMPGPMYGITTYEKILKQMNNIEMMYSDNYDHIKNRILSEYKKSDQSVCEWLDSEKCDNLTISESTKLYADLRNICDSDITCNIVSKDCVMLLNTGEEITFAELSSIVEDL